ncbi:hypothetical protein LPJ66_001581 [Kickxella alabastrina]|uniref:Uncharacterized protein n=1 Tax=Kickxella alabastrina TaxID=61397 RepID=A0ACC1ISU4_9FUNG|nr:hypothetical protein LPJ66_001581 [Kickxella alabastrina]
MTNTERRRHRHPLFDNSYLVLRIVRESFWIESGVEDRYHRLAYLQYIFHRSLVCRAWRTALQPILDSCLIVRISRFPRPTLQERFALARKHLQTLASRLQPIGKGKAIPRRHSVVSVTRVKQSNGTILHFCSNIPIVSPDQVHTIVVSVDGLLCQNQIDFALQKMKFHEQEWASARTLCLQLDDEPDMPIYDAEPRSHELTVQKVTKHAPNLALFYMVRPQKSQTMAKISLLDAFPDCMRQLQRLEVHFDINCSDIPPELPILTSLTLSVEPGSAASRRLPCGAAGSLQKMELYNVEPDLLLTMFEANAGVVRFAELKSLKLSLRTHSFGVSESDSSTRIAGVGVGELPVVFEKLESAHVFGFQDRVPVGLFPALARAPVRNLYVYLGIRHVTQLELDKMRHLRNLRLYLPQIEAVQPILDSVFVKRAEFLHTIYIYTHMRLSGHMPGFLDMPNIYNLNLGILIPFDQVRLIITQLPRLVFLKVMLARDQRTESALTLAEMESRVLENINPLNSLLQVLRVWHYEEFCMPDGRISLRAAMVTGLLASIPTLARFKGRVSVLAMRNSLARILDSRLVSAKAGHLRHLDVCEGYE